MKIKHFVAKDMRTAMANVTDEFGPNAVIMSTDSHADGVEIVAAIDYDESIFSRADASDNESPIPTSKASHYQEVAQQVSQATQPVAASTSGKYIDTDLVTEMQAMRQVMQKYLQATQFEEMSRQNPLETTLLTWMERCGFAKRLSEQLVGQLPIDMSQSQAKRKLAELISISISSPQKDVLSRGGIIAFTGATGVGKTTTIAKLAARYVLRHGAENIALITIDSLRIGANEQLATFGKLLNVPVYSAKDSETLKKRLNVLSDKKLILIDTAGMSPSDPRLKQQMALLQQANDTIQHCLVLSCATQTKAIKNIIDAYAGSDPVSCILTKLDECCDLAGILSLLIQRRLNIVYTSSGQQVPENIELAEPRRLVDLTLSLSQEQQNITQLELQGVADAID